MFTSTENEYMGIPSFTNADGKANTTLTAGSVWYNSTENHLYYYNGSTHVKITQKGINSASFDSVTNEITFGLSDGTSKLVNLDPISISNVTAENGEIVITRNRNNHIKPIFFKSNSQR